MNNLQKYRTATVSRKSLKEHPLNPRSITPQARKRLKAGIEKHGLVGPAFTINERTGYMLGGHQRLSVLDELMGTKDYDVEVAFVDKSDAEEKEILVLLNNQSAAGQWDEHALLDFFKDEDVDQDMLGFSETERMHFSRLMEEQEKSDNEAAKWMTEQADTYDAVREQVEEDQEGAQEQEKRRESKKTMWLKTVEEMMPKPVPRENANVEKDEAFRESRETWKKQPIEPTAFVRIVFKNSASKGQWLVAQGLTSQTDTVHELELPDQTWRNSAVLHALGEPAESADARA